MMQEDGIICPPYEKSLWKYRSGVMFYVKSMRGYDMAYGIMIGSDYSIVGQICINVKELKNCRVVRRKNRIAVETMLKLQGML